MVKIGKAFSIVVVFALLLVVAPALAPPVALASPDPDLPNPVTIDFSGTVSQGDVFAFNVVPNATIGTIINQFSRDPMILNVTSHNNTEAHFYNLSTASATLSGDVTGTTTFHFTRLDFKRQYIPAEDRFITVSPTGCGILFIRGVINSTELGNYTFTGVADMDYKGANKVADVKGAGLVCTQEPWASPPNLTKPEEVYIGELNDLAITSSGTAISGSFNLRHYSNTSGEIADMESLTLEGQLINDEVDNISYTNVTLSQFTKPPVTTTYVAALEEMAPGRELPQDIITGDIGVGGTISLQRTGVLDNCYVEPLDMTLPNESCTATRTIEDNRGSNMSSKRGVAHSIVLVDMHGFQGMQGVWQHAFTFMPGYAWGYDGPYAGTGYYAGFESYVIAATFINTSLWLEGPDYRFALCPTPVIDTVSPNVGKGGDTKEVTIKGKWLWVNETYHPLTIDFGPGVSVINQTVVSDTEVKVNITIAGGAGIGANDVSVTKRGVTGTLVDGFGVGSAVDGQVAFAGRGTAPADTWIEPFDVTVFDTGTSNVNWSGSATTNDTGVFSVTGLTPGTYDVGIKNCTCLSELETNVVLTLGDTTVADFTSTTREGDSNDDDWITGADRSILYTGWGTKEGSIGYTINADFNRDDWLTGADRSMMYTYWGQHGALV